MTGEKILILWFLVGILFSILAIWVFRRDGTTAIPGELYLATIGPVFGPIIGILIVIDLLKKPRHTLAETAETIAKNLDKQ